ncbi:ABC transporter substrate-binding protein [Pseudofrankia asymbiotica]|nr:ABC transporter substrate-binding protein [Pseudofrankia asymbiotica]
MAGLLAACSVASEESGNSRPGSCTTPGVSPTQIQLGAAIDDTGPGAATFGAFRSGVDARLGVANQAGGVNGRAVVYDWEDARSDPALNQKAVEHLIETKNTSFGIMQGSIVALGSADYTAERDIPVIGIGFDSSWNSHENMFSWTYYLSDGPATSTWGEFVKSQGGTRAALIGLSMNEASLQYQRQLTASLASAGVQVVYTSSTAGATSFGRLAEEMKNAGVDTIAGSVTPDVAAQLLPAVHAAGLAPKVVLLPSGYDSRLLQELGPQLAGSVIYLDFAPFELNLPVHQLLRSSMAKYAPETQPSAQQSVIYGWLAADLFLRGLEAAGECPSRESFISALRGIHDYDADGLLPVKIDLAKNKGQLSACYEFVRVSLDGSSFIPLSPSVRCGTRLH